MAASVQLLEGLVAHEVEREGVSEGKVVVGGFSQGALLSHLALCRRIARGRCELTRSARRNRRRRHLAPHGTQFAAAARRRVCPVGLPRPHP